jgi:hypothetical protein
MLRLYAGAFLTPDATIRCMVWARSREEAVCLAQHGLEKGSKVALREIASMSLAVVEAVQLVPSVYIESEAYGPPWARDRGETEVPLIGL